MGALTTYLLEDPNNDVWVMDIDTESIAYLQQHFPQLDGKIISADFLKLKIETLFGNQPFAVVGNFPYNISSQILFKCLEHRNQIPEIMGMFQKEVAERVAEKPGADRAPPLRMGLSEATPFPWLAFPACAAGSRHAPRGAQQSTRRDATSLAESLFPGAGLTCAQGR